MILYLVIPGNMVPSSGGVISSSSPFSFFQKTNKFIVPTARNACTEYLKNHNYTCIIDGYIVSDNIKASSRNINTEFKDSDHNPVVLTFSLE